MFGAEIFRSWLRRCLVNYDETISRHACKCTSRGYQNHT